jgi:hypothetical protein
MARKIVHTTTEETSSPDTARARILDEAMKITHHDRNANYGNPEDNFQHIANLWNSYLRVSRKDMPLVTPGDVAVMNMLIKVARLGNNIAHKDSAVDIAGYAACLGDIQENINNPKLFKGETALGGNPNYALHQSV